MENAEILREFYGRLHREFDHLAPVIIAVIVEELGGQRLTFPDRRTMDRMERDRRIRTRFNGCNGQELALAFDLSPRQIRTIVSDK
jgi:Mor family transcriptional regulator